MCRRLRFLVGTLVLCPLVGASLLLAIVADAIDMLLHSIGNACDHVDDWRNGSRTRGTAAV
jgi:hypothetical protein